MRAVAALCLLALALAQTGALLFDLPLQIDGTPRTLTFYENDDPAQVGVFDSTACALVINSSAQVTQAFCDKYGVNPAGVEQVLATVNSRIAQAAPKLASVNVKLGTDKSADLVLRKGGTIEATVRTFCEEQQISFEDNSALLVNALEAEYNIQQEKADPGLNQQAEETAPTGSKESSDMLPEGWVSVLDDASGQYYFAHPESGRSSWTKPTGEETKSASEDTLAGFHADESDELTITDVDDAVAEQEVHEEIQDAPEQDPPTDAEQDSAKEVVEETAKDVPGESAPRPVQETIEEPTEEELPSIILEAPLKQFLFELPLTVDGIPRPLSFHGGDNATKVAIEWCENYNGNFGQLSVVLDEVLRRFAEYKRVVEPGMKQPLARDPKEADARKTLAQSYNADFAEMVLAAERPAGEWLFALAVHKNGELLGVPVHSHEKPRELAEKWCKRRGISQREAPVIAAMVVKHYQDVYLWDQSWLDEIAQLLVVLAVGYVCGSFYEKWSNKDKDSAARKPISPTAKKGQKQGFSGEKKQKQDPEVPGVRRRGKMCIM
jgi:hypothetical protein